MVKRNTDCEQSPIFLKDSEVACPVSMEKLRDARHESRAFAAPRSRSWAQRQDMLPLMRYKGFNGYLDYLNTLFTW